MTVLFIANSGAIHLLASTWRGKILSFLLKIHHLLLLSIGTFSPIPTMKLHTALFAAVLRAANAQDTITTTAAAADATGSSSSASSVQLDSGVYLHGSGTTNPSKCKNDGLKLTTTYLLVAIVSHHVSFPGFWHILKKLEDQIKVPARLTYRAVGSGTGISEFLGKDIPKDSGINTFEAYNDFGSGDIPIDAEDRTTWNNAGIEFVQLPFVLSAVSFFHSIPGVPNGAGGLNMTACLLSRVFSGDIKTWDHADILEVNPGLSVPTDYVSSSRHIHKSFAAV